MDFILQWIDVLWLVLALAILRRPQRLYAAGFFIGSMIMMRLLAELMESIGYPRGIIGLIDMPVLARGMVLYSAVYLVYIVFMYARPQIPQAIVMAASISIFFISAILFSFLMVL